MSSLLFDERPLVVQPKLAFVLGGSDEAIILQQVHYWAQKNTNIKDGYSWVYNPMKEWQKQFPWIPERTLARKFANLEKSGVLVTNNYNKAKFDKTKWYRVDYDALDKMEHRLCQNSMTSMPDCHNGECQNGMTNTIDYTETTTDINNTSETQNVSDGAPKKTIKKKEYNFDSKEYRCALKLQEEILKNKPNFKKPNLQKWADTFRLIHERDKREWTEIGEMILYATQDDFWKANILSPDKLRKHFDLLEAQRERDSKPRKKQVFQRETLPDWAKDVPESRKKRGIKKTDSVRINAEIDALLKELELDDVEGSGTS